jgi:hypothetical protein
VCTYDSCRFVYATPRTGAIPVDWLRNFPYDSVLCLICQRRSPNLGSDENVRNTVLLFPLPLFVIGSGTVGCGNGRKSLRVHGNDLMFVQNYMNKQMDESNKVSFLIMGG